MVICCLLVLPIVIFAAPISPLNTFFTSSSHHYISNFGGDRKIERQREAIPDILEYLGHIRSSQVGLDTSSNSKRQERQVDLNGFVDRVKIL